MFKNLKFKQEVKEEKRKLFKTMQQETDATKWKELKEKYETYDKMEKPGGYISRDTIFATVGSIVSILLVLHYEKYDTITSKTFNWIRPKK